MYNKKQQLRADPLMHCRNYWSAIGRATIQVRLRKPGGKSRAESSSNIGADELRLNDYKE